MSAADQLQQLRLVKKLMEIGLVEGAWQTAGKTYARFKSVNWVFNLAASGAEKSVSLVMDPVVNLFIRPIKMVDSAGDALLDTVTKVNFVPTFESPRKIMKCSADLVMNNFVVQLLLCSADKVLLVAERVVTLLPEVEVMNVETRDENDISVVMNVLDRVRTIYSVATLPLQITNKVLHTARGSIQQYIVSTAEVKEESNRNPAQSRIGRIFDRILYLPLKGLHFLGTLAEQRSILSAQGHSDIIINTLECKKRLESVEKQWQLLENPDKLDDSSESDESSDDEVVITSPVPTSSSPLEQSTPQKTEETSTD